MDNFYARYPVSGGGVTSLNGLTGALTLVPGAGITITPAGSNITIASTALLAAITSINGDTTAAQTLSVGTSGTDFAIVDAGGGSHVFNLPTASATVRGALSSADWTTFNSKQPAGSYITALTGDVVAAGPGSAAATIQPNVVTNSKLAQMPSLTIKGNNTGGTANAADLTVAQVNTMLGDILANGTVAFTANQSLGSNKLTNVTDPTAAQDAATKNYVDASVAALQPATSVFAASTATIAGSYLNGVSGIGATFTTTSTATFTLDGTTPALGSRILIKNQTSGLQNGIYTFTTLPVGGVSGAIFTRALDYDTPSDVNNAGLIPVINGTVNALSSWQQIAVVTAIGVDPLVFSEFTANPSLYLLKANNLSDVASASTSFNNISPMTTLGDTLYGGASGAGTRLAGNITSVKQFLTQTGTGSVSAAPVWNAIANTDLSGITNTQLSGSAGITNANLAAMPANTLKGNATAGSLVPQDLTVAQVTSLIGVSAPTGNTLQLRDINGYSRSINFVTSETKTASSASPIVLTAASNGTQIITGTVAQTIQLPDATTINLGTTYTVINRTTQSITVNDGNAALVQTMLANTQAEFISTSSGSIGGSWIVEYWTNGDAFVNPMTTGGDTIYGGTAGAATRLANGSSGQVLTSSGGTSAPTWAPVTAVPGTMHTTGVSYTLLTTDSGAIVTATSVTITLPTAVGVSGKTYEIKSNVGGFINAITINTTSGQTIDNAGSVTIQMAFESYFVVSDGANWFIQTHYIPGAWQTYTPTITSFGTVATVGFQWKRVGTDLFVNGYFTAGTTVAALGSFSLPSGLSINTAVITRGNTTAASGQVVGQLSSTGSGNVSNIVTATGTSTTLVYNSGALASANSNIPENASGIAPTGGTLSIFFSVPISGWTA